MSDALKNVRVGIALTGSFCTFQSLFDILPTFVEAGAELIPILSYASSTMDTRFFAADRVKEILTQIAGRPPMTTIPEVEPIGPRKLLDLLIVAPCTGNTCAKLANGIADTPVTMAVKSQLRNDRPVLLGISTNDGLSAGAKNIGALMSRKCVFFIPYGQDDPTNKPASLVFKPNQVLEAAKCALSGVQRQPLLQTDS